jgi:hypothetical protein
MKINYGKQTTSFSLGMYAHNWGYPEKHEWEIGLYLLKWYVGVEFYK